MHWVHLLSGRPEVRILSGAPSRRRQFRRLRRLLFWPHLPPHHPACPRTPTVAGQRSGGYKNAGKYTCQAVFRQRPLAAYTARSRFYTGRCRPPVAPGVCRYSSAAVPGARCFCTRRHPVSALGLCGPGTAVGCTAAFLKRSLLGRYLPARPPVKKHSIKFV